MSQEEKQKNQYRSLARLDIVTLLVLLLISAIGLAVIGYTTWSNADRAGSDLANSYCLAEEHNFDTYKTYLEEGATYIDEMQRFGIAQEEIQKNLGKYLQDIKMLAGIDEIEPYAVIGKQLVWGNASKEQAQIAYDEISGQEWYVNALEADGAIIVTDAYIDTVYHKPVITFAKKCRRSCNVVAIDVFEEDFREWLEKQTLPEGSISYVFDANGMLFYTQKESAKEQEGFEEYAYQLFTTVKEVENSNTTGPLYIKDLQGEKQNIYYRKNTNNGYCILTIPHRALLLTYGRAYISYVIVFTITVGIIIYVWAKAYQERKANERMTEAVQVLGSSYYAVYRIHINEAKYEIIKGREYLSEDFPKKGNYEELLHKISSFMQKDVSEDFIESFSLDNIRRQIEKNIRDFGGDFQRDFDGSYQWVNVRILYEPSLSKNEVVLCLRKNEEEKQIQLRYLDTLQEALEAAQISENSQKQFFSSMSHDMRTPLNGIIGISEIAMNYVNEPEKMKEYLEKIQFSGRQLLGLINDILELSRVEQGIVLEHNRFNFKESMEECLNVFALQAEAAGKSFSQTYDIVNETVYGDSLRINQIMNNLLSNALKFTETGDSISVSVRELGEGKFIRYQIVVKDTGAGMSEEFQNHIFELYARETRFGSNIEGTGLGMPIVKSIVSQKGGEISVESVLKKGTTFTVTLPFEVAEEMKEAAPEGTQTGSMPEAGENGTAKPYTLQDKRILLAEDYELNMEIATEILEMEGAVVVQAWNGKEALERFEESEEYAFAAILMDMQMPEMDGCQATRKIRALARKDAVTIPIIALTANAFAENIASTTKAGMNAHIVKPIDVDLLCTTLGRLIAEEEKRQKEQR